MPGLAPPKVEAYIDKADRVLDDPPRNSLVEVLPNPLLTDKPDTYTVTLRATSLASKQSGASAEKKESQSTAEITLPLHVSTNSKFNVTLNISWSQIFSITNGSATYTVGLGDLDVDSLNNQVSDRGFYKDTTKVKSFLSIFDDTKSLNVWKSTEKFSSDGPTAWATKMGGNLITTYEIVFPNSQTSNQIPNKLTVYLQARSMSETDTATYEFSNVKSNVLLTLKAEIRESPAITAINLVSFNANADNNGGVTLAWETATEVDNAGFNLYRARGKKGKYKKINATIIPAQGSVSSGAQYTFEDKTPAAGVFFYKLEDVDTSGVSTMHGPEKVKVRK